MTGAGSTITQPGSFGTSGLTPLNFSSCGETGSQHTAEVFSAGNPSDQEPFGQTGFQGSEWRRKKGRRQKLGEKWNLERAGQHWGRQDGSWRGANILANRNKPCRYRGGDRHEAQWQILQTEPRQDKIKQKMRTAKSTNTGSKPPSPWRYILLLALGRFKKKQKNNLMMWRVNTHTWHTGCDIHSYNRRTSEKHTAVHVSLKTLFQITHGFLLYY